MKVTHNGKRYDSEKCEKLASHDMYSYSNNYAGTEYLMVASDGALLVVSNTNGQDCHIIDRIKVVSASYAQEWLERSRLEMDEDQEKRLVELGLIELIP